MIGVDTNDQACDKTSKLGACTVDSSIVNRSLPITPDGEVQVVQDMGDITRANGSTISTKHEEAIFETTIQEQNQNIVVEEQDPNEEYNQDQDHDDNDDDDDDQEEDKEYEFADKDRECSAWASRGECYKNAPYMLNNCLPSCSTQEEGLVSTGVLMEWDRKCDNKYEPEEEEDDDICDFWANAGLCTPDKDFMIDQCKKSCLACVSIE